VIFLQFTELFVKGNLSPSRSLTNTMCCATNCYRLLSVVLGSFNQSALRALRVLRPLKLVAGFSS